MRSVVIYVNERIKNIWPCTIVSSRCLNCLSTQNYKITSEKLKHIIQINKIIFWRSKQSNGPKFHFRGLDLILTHCRLNRLSHTIYWKSPISILGRWGHQIYIFLEKNGQTICKQRRPWADAAFCGVWSGSALFAKYPFTGLPTTME